jgi:hypothetical protein
MLVPRDFWIGGAAAHAADIAAYPPNSCYVCSDIQLAAK